MQTRCQYLQNKQRWNNNKCRQQCKELIDKGICNKGFIWNRSSCEYECHKLYDVGEYFDYEICKCRKKNQLINWLNNLVKILLEMK